MAGNGKVQVQMIGFATLKLTSPEGKYCSSIRG